MAKTRICSNHARKEEEAIDAKYGNAVAAAVRGRLHDTVFQLCGYGPCPGGDSLQQGGHGAGTSTKHHYDLYGIHFDFDKAVIQPDSNALLDDIATALKHFPKWRLRITGHTDSTGDAAYNEELSMNRANAIKKALVERGIDASRLETLGTGEKQPVASNDTPEGQALNRRVELVRLDVKPNILVHHGRRHRLVQHRRLSPRHHVWQDTEPRQARRRGHDVY